MSIWPLQEKLLESYSFGVPPGAAGGHCYLCKTAEETEYIRTFVEILYEGEVVICKGCAGTIASLTGFIGPEAYKTLLQQIESLSAEAKQNAAKAKKFDAMKEALSGKALSNKKTKNKENA